VKLFVIGNGFDIGHNICCKYSDFRKYLEENREDILEAMEKFYYIGENSELWSDFETSLEEDISYDSLAEIIGENSPNLASDDFSDGDWYNAQVYIEQECDELLENIRSGFEEWIGSLEISQVKRKYDLKTTDNFITFNYTDVLEKIYQIPTSKIFHIHNKVGEELIFGHGKSSEDFDVNKALYGDANASLSYDEYGNIESNDVGHEQFAENAVLAFYDKMRKNTEQIIQHHSAYFEGLRDVEEIVVLGHSYNEIDFPYFKKIAESVSENTKWNLFYFSDNDKWSAEKVIDRLEVADHLRAYKHCDLLEQEYTQLKLL